MTGVSGAQTFDDLLAQAADGKADAQYELGRHYAARQEFARARRWLDRASMQNHALAQTELGLLLLYGIGLPHDIAGAIGLLKRAAGSGSAEANFQLALISLGEAELQFDAHQCMQWLSQSAHGGFAQAWRNLGLAWAHAGEDPQASSRAEQCFRRAIALGDMVSAFLLGWQHCQTDPDDALGQQLLHWAAEHGIERARAFIIGSNPTGASLPEPDAGNPPSPPIDLLIEKYNFHKIEIRTEPYLATFDSVFSALECEYVIALGTPYLEHSDTIHPETGERLRNDYRNSSSMSFFQFQEDFWLRVLQRRLSALAGSSPLANAEYLALLRYLPGEEYKPHRDYLPLKVAERDAMNHPGQRVSTIFCYLNTVNAGGATDFPVLKERIEPLRGRCVLFRNLKPDGAPDPDTLHAGLPVIRGEKWLATLWVRERRYRLY